MIYESGDNRQTGNLSLQNQGTLFFQGKSRFPHTGQLAQDNE
jgi:hypothetical protein